MKKILFITLFNFFLLLYGLLQINPAAAQTPTPRNETGPCNFLTCSAGQTKKPLGSNICECTGGTSATGDDVFGTIEAPEGVAQYNAAAGAEGGIGLIVFLSNLIRIATVVAGVWVMVNFIMAGWTYIISAGDTKAHTDAAQKMTYSVVGLAVIVGAYTLTAVVSLVLFGDAGYILSPTFRGPGGP